MHDHVKSLKSIQHAIRCGMFARCHTTATYDIVQIDGNDCIQMLTMHTSNLTLPVDLNDRRRLLLYTLFRFVTFHSTLAWSISIVALMSWYASSLQNVTINFVCFSLAECRSYRELSNDMYKCSFVLSAFFPHSSSSSKWNCMVFHIHLPKDWCIRFICTNQIEQNYKWHQALLID